MFDRRQIKPKMAVFGLLAGCPVKYRNLGKCSEGCSEGIHESLLRSITARVFQSSIPFFPPLDTVFPGTPELLLKSSKTCLSRLETQAPLQKTELLWPKA